MNIFIKIAFTTHRIFLVVSILCTSFALHSMDRSMIETVQDISVSKEQITFISLIGRTNNNEFNKLTLDQRNKIISFYPLKTYDYLKQILSVKIAETGFTQEQSEKVIQQFFVEYFVSKIRWASPQKFVEIISDYDAYQDTCFALEDFDDVKARKAAQNDFRDVEKKMKNMCQELCDDNNDSNWQNDTRWYFTFRSRLMWPIAVCTTTSINFSELLNEIQALTPATLEQRKEFNTYLQELNNEHRAQGLTAVGYITANPGLCQWD